MKTLSLFLIISLLLSCTDKPKEDTSELSTSNPFNVALNEPIAYEKVTVKHLSDYVDVTVSDSVKALEQIKNTDNLSFSNTFEKFDAIYNDLIKADNNAFMLNWVSTDEYTRAKGTQGSQKIKSLITDIYTDKALFNVFQAFAGTEEGKSLTGSKKTLVVKTLDDFKQYGVNLTTENLKHYKRLSDEITALTVEYSTNMNSAEETLILNEEQTAGLPDNFKDTYRAADGTYTIPVINATNGTVMRNAESSEVRKAFATKMGNIASDTNLKILDSLIIKRDELANIMGYETFAAYQLAPKMAKTPERVWAFINDLVEQSKSKALSELKMIESFKNTAQDTPDSTLPLAPWDISFYINQIVKTKYQVDYEQMRDYLPMEASLEGMFSLYQELLGLEFRQVKDPSVWHDDVTMFEVFEKGNLKGTFYLDLYPRANKETWFYGVTLASGKMTPSGYEVPVAMLLGNFTKPTDTLPSLLSIGELSTLYHEFGHIMNTISYEGQFALLSDTKADFAEAMSQIFENWLDDYETLSAFAKHYKTGEVFPKELFENMQNAQTLSLGIGTQSSLRYSLYDMHLYDNFNPEQPVNTDKLWQEIDTKMGVLDRYIDGTHPQASWIHINTHPVYMYGYLWSEVYAKDLFTVFQKNGLRDTDTGMRYRKLILANGSQRDIEQAVEEFIGRPSNNEAYIKSLGIE